MTIHLTIHSTACRVRHFLSTVIDNHFQLLFQQANIHLKHINTYIRTWFRISSHLTKKAQDWIYSYQSRILLLSLNMFCSFLSCLCRWFGTFICLLEWLLEESLRFSMNICLSSLENICEVAYF